MSKDKSSQAPLDQWESAIYNMLDPEHLDHEKNPTRQHIKLATLAAELGLKVETNQITQRIAEILRAKQNAEQVGALAEFEACAAAAAKRNAEMIRARDAESRAANAAADAALWGPLSN